MVAHVGERRTGTVAGQLPEVGVTTPGTTAGSCLMTFRQSYNETIASRFILAFISCQISNIHAVGSAYPDSRIRVHIRVCSVLHT